MPRDGTLRIGSWSIRAASAALTNTRTLIGAIGAGYVARMTEHKNTAPGIAPEEQCLFTLCGTGDEIRTRSPLLGKQMRYHCATPVFHLTLAVFALVVKIIEPPDSRQLVQAIPPLPRRERGSGGEVITVAVVGDPGRHLGGHHDPHSVAGCHHCHHGCHGQLRRRGDLPPIHQRE